MKYIKYLTAISLVVLFSCKSTYRNPKIAQFENNPFKVLDSLESTKRRANFSIETVSDWELKSDLGAKYYVPRVSENSKLSPSLSIYRTDLKKEVKNSVNLDDYFNFYILNKEKWNRKKFNYKLVKAKHKLYDEIYVINYIKRFNLNEQIEKSDYLIVHNNVGYTISYTAEPKVFHRRYPEVEMMINSFRILD
ncbi:MAG: hypothetical protein MK202_16155 [Tenacibaculum sp.]|nr:hypothetical protein [Tenacibaculum sp.]